MRKKPNTLAARLVLATGLTLVALLLLVPLSLIFAKALGEGLPVLWENLQADFMQHAIGLTLFVAVITVPLNMLLGIALAWCMTHYDFVGKRVLSVIIDIPYAVSPVVAGLCYLVVYGVEGIVGHWFAEHDIQLMFAWPGILLVTIFVTTPYVARILIPLMQAQGSDAETAALSLGANGWQIFWHVSLPDIKWGLMYGVVLTNARAIGEFGAVSIVSGTIMNQTLTLSLLVEQLNNDNKAAAAFTAAALLAVIAIASVVIKSVVEWRLETTERVS